MAIDESHIKKVFDTIPESLHAEVKKFDRENKARGLKIGTRINYLKVLKSLTSHTDKPFREMEKGDIMDWVNSLECTQGTITLYKVCAKRFFQWLYDCEKRVYPPVVSWITTKRTKRNNIEVLTLDDVKRMAEVTTNQRDRAMIIMLYESAARADELLTLKIRDVKLDRFGAVIMVTGKTGSRRIRLVDSVPDLQLWMNMHTQKNNQDAPLWVAHTHGGGLKYIQLHHITVQLGKKAGIEKRVHPHIFRHSRLTELAKSLSDGELKVFAGWEPSSNMAGTYVHLSGKDLDKTILGLHGLLEEDEKVKDRPLSPKKCPRCEINNPPTAKFCYRCSAVLDIKAALELEEACKAPNEWLDSVMNDKEKLFAEFMEFTEFKKAQGKP